MFLKINLELLFWSLLRATEKNQERSPVSGLLVLYTHEVDLGFPSA